MIIEEAIKNFSPEELKLHELLKDADEPTLYEYIIKRNFYKEPTKEEIDSINDIYEEGVTYVNVYIRDKEHKIKLLNYEDKQKITDYLDAFEKNIKTGTEESKKTKIYERKVLLTVALSLVEIDKKSIASTAEKQITALGSQFEGILAFLGFLPYVMVKTLFDKYVEFEARIYDIFSYESIRKK